MHIRRRPPIAFRRSAAALSAAGRSTRCRRRPISFDGSRFRCRRPTISWTASLPGRERRSAAALGRGRAHVRGQHSDARPLLLQRGRRDGDRAAARSPDSAHRARDSRRAARRDLRGAARGEASRRAAGRHRARLHLRELRPAPAAAGSRAHRHGRPGQRPRLPGTGGRVRRSRGGLPPRAKFGGGLWRPRSITRRSTSWRGAATTSRQIRPHRFQTINTSATTIRTRRSTVLASPSSVPGTANMEFGALPRWSVAEHIPSAAFTATWPANSWAHLVGISARPTRSRRAAPACTTACRGMDRMPRPTSAAAR